MSTLPPTTENLDNYNEEKIMFNTMYSNLIDNLGDWNPQLFREIKGRLTKRNVALISGISLIGQFLLYLNFQSHLPKAVYYSDYTNRYCVGIPPSDWSGYHDVNNFCVQDLLGNFAIMKDLWWLDIFTTMSIIGIFALLVVGSYMLIADLSKEERTGTLNFIRVSPQSALSIFVGKMLGVPILVYLFGLIAFPLHIVTGLNAGIPLHLIFAFYVVLAFSCVFFYTMAIAYTLVSSSLGSFQAWLGSGAIFFFLLTIMSATLESYSNFTETSFDWLILFYPGTALFYLVKSTFLNPDTINYLKYDSLASLTWYGQSLWQNPVTGIGFMLVNYAIWSFWLIQGFKRRFHNPLATIISKKDSYLLSLCFIVLNLGFTFQDFDNYHVQESFNILQVLNLGLFLILIACLSPHRQTLQDWARYRHQNPKETRSLLRDLIFGEKSPAVLAIAINVALVTIYTIPSVLLFPLDDYKIPALMGLFLNGVIVLIYATVAQLMVMLKTNKRGLFALGGVTALVIAPVACFALFSVSPSEAPTLWLFSLLPSIATEQIVSVSSLFGVVLTQITAIVALNYQMTRLLRKAGMSETKALLSEATV
jgi:hypothetical protein